MTNCPNCGNLVSGSFCSMCGYNLAAVQPATAPQPQQPPHQPAPAPPPPPAQSQHPPPQQYQQYPPPSQPPGYGPQYGPPPPVQKRESIIKGPKAIGGLVLALLGGVGLIIGPFLAIIVIAVPVYGWSHYYYYGYSFLVGGQFAYGFLIPVFGLLLILTSIIPIFRPALRRNKIVTQPWIFPISALIVGIVLVVHMLTSYSAIYPGSSWAEVSTGVYVTGIASILGIIGGVLVSQVFREKTLGPMGPYGPQGASPYGQPQSQYPPQQYPQQQYQQQQYPPQQPPPSGPPPGQ